MLSPKIRQARRGKSNFLWVVRHTACSPWQSEAILRAVLAGTRWGRFTGAAAPGQ